MAKKQQPYNRIYNESDWNKVNPKNKELVDDYIKEYTQRKKSAQTIIQYKNNLRIILILILKHFNNEYLLDMKKKQFRDLSLMFTQNLGLSAARSNSLMSALRSLLTYIEDEDDYEYVSNVARRVRGIPKKRVRDDENDFFITFDEFIKVRDILVERNKLQYAVMFSLFFDSGARRNEVFQVKKEGLLTKNKTNIVNCKGVDRNEKKKKSLVYMNDTRDLIEKYLIERGEDDIESLWIKGCGENKQEINVATLYDRIKYCGKIIREIRGDDSNIFPHSLRHSRSEVLLTGTDPRILDKEGNPKKFTLEEIQMFLGHNDPGTTQNYLKDKSEEFINEMFNLTENN